MDDKENLTRLKIPKIEFVLIIPSKINQDIIKIINKYKKLAKSTKILKKSKYRLKTNDFIKKLKLSDLLGNLMDPNDKIFVTFLNNFSNNNFFADFREIYNNDKTFDKNIFTNYLIDLLDEIFLKYIKILVHLDDQVYIISKKNKICNKIFLKFFLPKIFTNIDTSIDHTINERSGLKYVNGDINKNSDNIHVTILPTICGHLFDGIIHITFRLEGKSKTVFEYSKFLSMNREANKFGFVVYNDSSLSGCIIFKLTNNLDDLMYYMRTKFYYKVIDIFVKSEEFNDLCKYISMDIFNEMIASKVIDYFLTKYNCGIGIEIFTKIIGLLLKIVFFTFIDLSFL